MLTCWGWLISPSPFQDMGKTCSIRQEKMKKEKRSKVVRFLFWRLVELYIYVALVSLPVRLLYVLGHCGVIRRSGAILF